MPKAFFIHLTGVCWVGDFSIPMAKAHGHGQSVPPGRFFFPPLFRGKRGGQGVSSGKLFNRQVRGERNVLFSAPLASVAVLREKASK